MKPSRNYVSSLRAAGPQDEHSEPVRRDLHGWYRWLKKQETWLKIEERDWRRASWRTRLWWIRKELRGLIGPPKPFVREAAASVRKWGKVVSARYGVSVARQILEIIWLYLHLGINPDFYYKYYFFLKEWRALSKEVITNYQIAYLLTQLNQRAGVKEDLILNDKLVFYQFCSDENLSIIPTLCAFDDGKVTPLLWKPGAPLPQADLYVKPVRAFGGRGGTQFRFNKNGYVGGRPARRYSASELTEMLRKQSKEEPLILQERVHAHPTWEGFSPGALAIVRIVTARTLEGSHETISAMFTMPTKSSEAANFGQKDCLGAPLDISSGRLGKAVTKYPDAGPESYAVHPDTRCPIENERLPGWHEIKRLAEKAHQSFEMPFIGWDIAYARQGPIIAEGNVTWSPDTHQILHKTPLTRTRFQPLYDAWMQRCIRNEDNANARSDR